MRNAPALLALVLAASSWGCAGNSETPKTPENESAQEAPAIDDSALAAGDAEKLEQAALLMDDGKLEQSIALLKELRARHPHHGSILHESALAERFAKRPEKAIGILWPYRQTLSADGLALLGSALDEAGRPEDAFGVLLTGLKRFPKSGMLHSEMGTTLRGLGKNDQAAGFYARGIDVDPGTPSNYMHLAVMFSQSDAPVLSLFFGEAFRLLEPSSPRSFQIGALMTAVCRDSVNVKKKEGDELEASVHLAPPISIDKPEQAKDLPLPNQLELSIGPGLVIAHREGLSLASLHAARKSFLQSIRSPESPLHELSLYQWLQELDDAGHLEAYNHWLYGPGFPAEYEAWSKTHPESEDAFAQYMGEHPLVAQMSR